MHKRKLQNWIPCWRKVQQRKRLGWDRLDSEADSFILSTSKIWRGSYLWKVPGLLKNMGFDERRIDERNKLTWFSGSNFPRTAASTKTSKLVPKWRSSQPRLTAVEVQKRRRYSSYKTRTDVQMTKHTAAQSIVICTKKKNSSGCLHSSSILTCRYWCFPSPNEETRRWCFGQKEKQRGAVQLQKKKKVKQSWCHVISGNSGNS